MQRALHCRCGREKIRANGHCATCYALRRHDAVYFGGLREQVLERDGYCCRVCGASGRSKQSIAVHHRKPGKSLLQTMIALCPGCHAKVHRTLAVLSEMPPLLLELWREQHPHGHEQTVLNFRAQMPATRGRLCCSKSLSTRQASRNSERPLIPSSRTNTCPSEARESLLFFLNPSPVAVGLWDTGHYPAFQARALASGKSIALLGVAEAFLTSRNGFHSAPKRPAHLGCSLPRLRLRTAAVQHIFSLICFLKQPGTYWYPAGTPGNPVAAKCFVLLQGALGNPH